MDRERTTVFGKSNPRKQSRGVISAGSNEDRILILAGNPVEIWCDGACNRPVAILLSNMNIGDDTHHGASSCYSHSLCLYSASPSASTRLWRRNYYH